MEASDTSTTLKTTSIEAPALVKVDSFALSHIGIGDSDSGYWVIGFSSSVYVFCRFGFWDFFLGFFWSFISIWVFLEFIKNSILIEFRKHKQSELSVVFYDQHTHIHTGKDDRIEAFYTLNTSAGDDLDEAHLLPNISFFWIMAFRCNFYFLQYYEHFLIFLVINIKFSFY